MVQQTSAVAKRTIVSNDASAFSASARAARKMLRPLKHQIIQLLSQLVQIDTVAIPPNGNETRAQKALRKTLKSFGLDVELYDISFLTRSNHPYVRHERNYAGRQNLIARLPGTGRGRSLLISGHMDTVPSGREQWKDSLWSGVVRRGRMYGRGTYDMKGGLVAGFGALTASFLHKKKVQPTDISVN